MDEYIFDTVIEGREETEEEIAERELLHQEALKLLNEETERQSAKESALSKLAKLGLTEEEARAVIGL